MGSTGATLFDGSADVRVPIDFLQRIQRGEVSSASTVREVPVAIAHGLAFDPHLDGRLRLTPTGLAKVHGR